ncbi:hypothetical protein LTS10_009158 [Elasticomyces elasticus]|nr:hypothetical protein LTS10_009158 [Elasticomyces elasticus]
MDSFSNDLYNGTRTTVAAHEAGQWIPDLKLTVDFVSGLVTISLKIYQIYVNIKQLRRLDRIAQERPFRNRNSTGTAPE